MKKAIFLSGTILFLGTFIFKESPAAQEGKVGETPPLDFEDKKTKTVLTFTQDKAANIPKLDWEKVGEEKLIVKPQKQWLGHNLDLIQEGKPLKPITTQQDFEKLWKAWRGKEETPKIDFAKQFAVARSLPGARLNQIGLSIEPGGKVVIWESIILVEGKKLQGFTYVIGVFSRDQFDLIGGQIVPKK